MKPIKQGPLRQPLDNGVTRRASRINNMDFMTITQATGAQQEFEIEAQIISQIINSSNDDSKAETGTQVQNSPILTGSLPEVMASTLEDSTGRIIKGTSPNGSPHRFDKMDGSQSGMQIRKVSVNEQLLQNYRRDSTRLHHISQINMSPSNQNHRSLSSQRRLRLTNQANNSANQADVNIVNQNGSTDQIITRKLSQPGVSGENIQVNGSQDGFILDNGGILETGQEHLSKDPSAQQLKFADDVNQLNMSKSQTRYGKFMLDNSSSIMQINLNANDSQQRLSLRDSHEEQNALMDLVNPLSVKMPIHQYKYPIKNAPEIASPPHLVEAFSQSPIFIGMQSPQPIGLSENDPASLTTIKNG